MSNLQIIEGLCQVVETQARIINQAAARLREVEALDEALAEEIEASERDYTHILGAGEVSDAFTAD